MSLRLFIKTEETNDLPVRWMMCYCSCVSLCVVIYSVVLGLRHFFNTVRICLGDKSVERLQFRDRVICRNAEQGSGRKQGEC